MTQTKLLIECSHCGGYGLKVGDGAASVCIGCDGSAFQELSVFALAQVAPVEGNPNTFSVRARCPICEGRASQPCEECSDHREYVLQYHQFVGRRHRTDIPVVRTPEGATISYNDFLVQFPVGSSTQEAVA